MACKTTWRYLESATHPEKSGERDHEAKSENDSVRSNTQYFRDDRLLGLMARIVRTLRLSSYPRLPVSEVGYIWHEDKGNNLQMGKYN